MQIAIASGKGGTGKTTLAVNLSVLLAEKFSGSDRSVLLTDLDVEEPNSGLFLKGEICHQEVKVRMVPQWDEDRCTLCKRCANVCEFNAIAFLGVSVLVFPELCHSCYACSDLCPENALPMVRQRMGEMKVFSLNNHLQFIESRLDIGVEQATPLIEQTRKYIGEQYGPDEWFVILDAPPGTSCPVMEAVKDADLVILVTEPTPFGFHDLKLAMETMNELGKPFAVVINKDGIGNDDVLHYCRENGVPVIGRIPNMREAAKRYSTGQLMVDEIPEIRQEVEKIYQQILKLTEGEA